LVVYRQQLFILNTKSLVCNQGFLEVKGKIHNNFSTAMQRPGTISINKGKLSLPYG